MAEKTMIELSVGFRPLPDSTPCRTATARSMSGPRSAPPPAPESCGHGLTPTAGGIWRCGRRNRPCAVRARGRMRRTVPNTRTPQIASATRIEPRLAHHPGRAIGNIAARVRAGPAELPSQIPAQSGLRDPSPARRSCRSSRKYPMAVRHIGGTAVSDSVSGSGSVGHLRPGFGRRICRRGLFLPPGHHSPATVPCAPVAGALGKTPKFAPDRRTGRNSPLGSVTLDLRQVPPH